jgi:hypothetical protein
MRRKWLVMTALAGAILTFASRPDVMPNTMPAGLAKSADQVGQVEQARWFVVRFDAGGGRTTMGTMGTTAIAIDRGGVGTGAGRGKLSSARESSPWPCRAQGQFFSWPSEFSRKSPRPTKRADIWPAVAYPLSRSRAWWPPSAPRSAHLSSTIA